MVKRHLSDNHKKKLSKAHKGIVSYIRTDAHRKQISDRRKGKSSWSKGKHFSEEHRRKISESNKGKTRPPVSIETRKKMSEALKGKKRTKDYCRKVSLRLTGHKLSEEWRHNLSLAHLGKKHTEQQKIKMSLAHKGEKHWNWKGGAKRAHARVKNKRRQLGCIPFNNQEYDYWVGHHMDKEHVMYIPLGLHKATHHALNNQTTMNKINKLVIEWYINYYKLI